MSIMGALEWAFVVGTVVLGLTLGMGLAVVSGRCSREEEAEEMRQRRGDQP